MKLIASLLLASFVTLAQDPVVIQVDTAVRQGPFKPITSYSGYDEPNYTYMKNGAKLIAELAGAGPTPVYIRAHHLLCTGDGTPALKWGSTNAYTEDAAGKPVYDWTIVDRIFDTYSKVNARPFVEIGFMPEALSTHPEPYATKFNQKDSGTGWSYPPKDYAKWGELIYQWVRHSVDRYGEKQVLTWYWELWNEPDISYWRGTPEEYDRLYDYTSAAVKRALPGARVGGPATTDPMGAKAAGYLQQFLEHCARGPNAATGKTGAPLDFITYHSKGGPNFVAGHVQMGLARNLQNTARGFEIISSFPQYQHLPIIISEYDPEGCAACTAKTRPQNGYRNGTVYPTYTAASIKNLFLLADRFHTNIEGMLTWAFEFENQPYFEGFRTLATNGIDKPILNVFRMAGKLSGDLVKVSSTGAVSLTEIMQTGVRSEPDIDALATRSDHAASVLLWNYHDDDVPAADAPVRLVVSGLPEGVATVTVNHFRIDRDHSNAFAAWEKMGSPQQPSAEQYARLEAAGKLQELEPSHAVKTNGHSVALEFPLPRQAVSLVQLTWQ
jgi:xylan 1,4-beta-xylosidase